MLPHGVKNNKNGLSLMFNKSSQKPLIVELMDLSQQNESILKFFISGVGRKVFKIAANPTEVEAYIMDYDFPGAEAHWDSEFKDSNKPRIIISTYDPKIEGAVWVGKPLSSKSLITAAESVHALNVNNVVDKKASLEIDDSNEEDNKDNASNFVIPEPKVEEKKTTLVPKKSTLKEKKTLASLVAETEVAQQDKEKEEFTLVDNHAKLKTTSTDGEEIKKHTPLKEEKVVSAEQVEARWKELCGDSDDVNVQSSKDIRYVQSEYFISKLIAAVRLARQSQQNVEIQCKPYSVYILPNEHQIFTEFDIEKEDFLAFSRSKIKLDDMPLHILSGIESGKLELQMNNQPDQVYSLESFIWTSSLLVSQGRLPEDLDIEKKTALKYWPSFARIEAFPYSMRIAALWHHSPDSVVALSKKLGIPQRYVFAFYNGANALDLIERDPRRVKQQMKAKPKKGGGGLISRLFRRLLKGGPTPS